MNDEDEEEMPLFYASHNSDPGSLGGKISHTMRELLAAGKKPQLFVQGIGAGAINQAAKAFAIAANQLRGSGHEPAFVPEFRQEEIDGQQRTALRWTVFLATGRRKAIAS